MRIGSQISSNSPADFATALAVRSAFVDGGPEEQSAVLSAIAVARPERALADRFDRSEQGRAHDGEDRGDEGPGTLRFEEYLEKQNRREPTDEFELTQRIDADQRTPVEDRGQPSAKHSAEEGGRESRYLGMPRLGDVSETPEALAARQCAAKRAYAPDRRSPFFGSIIDLVV